MARETKPAHHVRRGFENPHPACGVGSNCNTLQHAHTISLSFLSLSLSFTDLHTHTHTHTHAHDTHGAAWVQVLCKEGGMPLLMCLDEDGWSCLYIAAQKGHTAVVEVRAGGGRQQEAGGHVGSDGTRHVVQGL